MTELSDIPPKRRLERFRQLAGDADRAVGAVRQSYVLIAEQWDRLAAELAKEIEPDAD